MMNHETQAVLNTIGSKKVYRALLKVHCNFVMSVTGLFSPHLGLSKFGDRISNNVPMVCKSLSPK